MTQVLESLGAAARRLGASAALAAALAALPAAWAGAHTPHTVAPGESLWSIAEATGVGVERLAADNGFPPDAQLLAGTVLQIPEQLAVEASGRCTWDCQSTAHPHPTDEVASPELIGDAAAQEGMSSSLVEAIASVESGFDNSAVSSAGARGVMQIIPETWQFIDENLAAGPLDPTSAAANVEAGVLYLHHLYHLKGGDREATIGSYFQGPNRDGVLPETLDYIERVDARQADLLAGG